MKHKVSNNKGRRLNHLLLEKVTLTADLKSFTLESIPNSLEALNAIFLRLVR